MKYLAIILMLSINVNNGDLEAFKKELKQTEIKHKNIVLKQAILETGWFSSETYKKKNNPFGFYYKGKYKEFKTIRESLEYYQRWQEKYYKGGDYYDFLNCMYKTRKGVCIRYAEDSEYTDKLKKIKINLE